MPSNSKVHVKSKGILKKLGRDIGRVKCFKIKVTLLNTDIFFFFLEGGSPKNILPQHLAVNMYLQGAMWN